MTIYELTNKGCESAENILGQIIFQEDRVLRKIKNDNELKLEYDSDNMPFVINRSHLSILLQDIHNNIPCGILFVSVPVGEDFDTIIYIVRFDEKEFVKIKKFA